MRNAAVVAPAALVALLALAVPRAGQAAGEPEVLYAVKVTTMEGQVFQFPDLGHELERGSFVYHDGETEGRVAWRDLDRVVFVARLGHQPDAVGPRMRGAHRVRLDYVTGEQRVVNLIIGQVHGHDGVAQRQLRPRQLAQLDFDETRIAPKLYKACTNGHAWEQVDYRYCPWDGLPLKEFPVE